MSHKTPTVNEQERFRRSRGLGFRARPVDPKVFTSAGDLGVPRIRKQPLTIPVSPVFSKPRVKTTTANVPIPVRTALTSNLEHQTGLRVQRRPVTYPATRVTRVDALASRGSATDRTASTGNATSTISKADRPNPFATDRDALSRVERSSQPAPSEKASVVYPTILNSRATQHGRFRRVIGLSAEGVKRNAIRGPPLREEGSKHVTVSKPSSNDRAVPSAATKRPLTQPIPFKFATDDVLRRHRELFRRQGDGSVPTAVPKAESRVDKRTGAVRRLQSSLVSSELG